MFKCTQRWLWISFSIQRWTACAVLQKKPSIWSQLELYDAKMSFWRLTLAFITYLHTAPDWTQEQLISNSSFRMTHAKDQIRELRHRQNFILYWNTTHSFPFQATRKYIQRKVRESCQSTAQTNQISAEVRKAGLRCWETIQSVGLRCD